jgi:hypothetical protein
MSSTNQKRREQLLKSRALAEQIKQERKAQTLIKQRRPEPERVEAGRIT